jgi:Protein of unknown function (DUF2809)
MGFRFSLINFSIAVALFIVEVLIAVFMHDRFVRPYVGDYLVVFLVYYAIASLVDCAPWQTGLFTLLFAYAVEFLQYIKFIERVKLEGNVLARTVLGVGFEWKDIMAYTLGVGTVLLIERLRRRSVFQTKKTRYATCHQLV